MLVAFARWTADADPNRHFPWITLLVTGLISSGLAFFTLQGTAKAAKVAEVKTTPGS